jgi:hypothetical protein
VRNLLKTLGTFEAYQVLAQLALWTPEQWAERTSKLSRAVRKVKTIERLLTDRVER